MTTQITPFVFFTDDDLPRFPMPTDDAMDSAQARRFLKSINEGSSTPSEPLKSPVKIA
jgi:hypothetical protein